MLLGVNHPDGLVTHQSALLAQAQVPHAFSTRLGGVSAAPFDTLNLAHPGVADTSGPADDPVGITHNYERLLAAIGCEHHARAWVHQVHGRQTVRVDESNVQEHPEADAMITGRPGIALSIRVADCVPILIAVRSGGQVAAAHAGWRGIVTGVVPATVNELSNCYDLRACDLVAAVGPCISAAHYEVGPEVVQAFLEAGLGATIHDGSGGKAHVDLAGAVAAQLTAAGLDPSMIDRSQCCTYRDADLFYSHRRDAGITGRMAAIIAVKASGTVA